MPLRRSAHAIKRKIEEAQAEQLMQGVPADRVRNQLPGSTLPPGGPSGSGYPPDPDAVTRIDVRKNSAGSVFSRRRLNLIEGSGATLTVADDSGNEEVDITIAVSGGSGTVTSVALTAPSEIGVAGSPITTAGTIALSWATESAHAVFAGPTSGSAATPAFRSLIAADIPNLDWSKITSGTPTTLAGYGITDAYTIAQVDSGFSTVGHAHAVGVAGPGRFYYLDAAATADVNSYKQALTAPSSNSETTISQANTGTGDTLIATFITYPTGGIGVTSLPSGISTRVFRVTTGATNQECRLKVDFYISVSPYAPGNETLVRSDYSPTFAGTAIIDLTWNFAASSAVAMNTTDRVVMRVSTARVSGPTTCTATVYFDGTTHLSYIQTTLPAPVDILTTRGDLLTRDASNMTRLGVGSSGTFLRSNGSDPSWQAIVSGDIPDLSATYQPLDADLTAIAALSSTGLAARTAANTWAQRTITGTLNSITVTNGDGVSGNPTIAIHASYGGQSSITTLGTITQGVWNGTVIAAGNGGTGQIAYAVGDLLYASGSSALSRLADVATGNALISGGVTTAPSWGKIALATHVSGTLPAANGGTGATAMPAFSAHKNGTDQTGVATTTFTKVTWSTEDFDSNSNFASDKFTPSVAGTYLITFSYALIATVDQTVIVAAIFKNGAEYRRSQPRASGTGTQGASVSALVALNGSTDFVEAYAFQNSGATQVILGLAVFTYFSGAWAAP